MNTGNNYYGSGGPYDAGVPGLIRKEIYFPSDNVEPLDFSEPHAIGPPSVIQYPSGSMIYLDKSRDAGIRNRTQQ